MVEVSADLPILLLLITFASNDARLLIILKLDMRTFRMLIPLLLDSELKNNPMRIKFLTNLKPLGAEALGLGKSYVPWYIVLCVLLLEWPFSALKTGISIK